MQFFTTIAGLAVMIGLASAGASIDSYSAGNCGSGYQGRFNIASNGGQCYAQTSSQGMIVRSVDQGCVVTVYCDSSCGSCANVANLGACRTGVSGYSVDC